MNAYADLMTLLGGLGAILVAASLIGYVLQRLMSPDGSNSVIENLNDRIRAWWAMVSSMRPGEAAVACPVAANSASMAARAWAKCCWMASTLWR